MYYFDLQNHLLFCLVTRYVRRWQRR